MFGSLALCLFEWLALLSSCLLGMLEPILQNMQFGMLRMNLTLPEEFKKDLLLWIEEGQLPIDFSNF